MTDPVSQSPDSISSTESRSAGASRSPFVAPSVEEIGSLDELTMVGGSL
jgi:hypothetical protein